MGSIEHLMVEFTRLVERRNAGDASPDLDREIAWAGGALRVAQLRAEKAELEAIPERTTEQDLRLIQIEEERLSSDIQLHPSAYAQDPRFHEPRGRAIDFPARATPARSPWARQDHVHWTEPGR